MTSKDFLEGLLVNNEEIEKSEMTVDGRDSNCWISSWIFCAKNPPSFKMRTYLQMEGKKNKPFKMHLMSLD